MPTDQVGIQIRRIGSGVSFRPPYVLHKRADGWSTRTSATQRDDRQRAIEAGWIDGTGSSRRWPGIVPVILPMGDLRNLRGVRSQAQVRRHARRPGHVRRTSADSQSAGSGSKSLAAHPLLFAQVRAADLGCVGRAHGVDPELIHK